jgi:hypothetical protein
MHPVKASKDVILNQCLTFSGILLVEVNDKDYSGAGVLTKESDAKKIGIFQFIFLKKPFNKKKYVSF